MVSSLECESLSSGSAIMSAQSEIQVSPRRLQKMLRWLRVAFSTLAGIACLLMIAWWVRSYSWIDGGSVKLCSSEYVQFHAGDGRLVIWFEHKSVDGWFRFWSRRFDEPRPPAAERIPVLDIHAWPTFVRVYTAHWLLIVI